MAEKRVALYPRLPEIYRIKDADLPKLFLRDGQPVPSHQLRAYLEPAEDMFSAIHENIDSLYHDLFIEHCDPWVIPYIGDLLGTTHLSGDEWTLRADVADTIALRRRKGTLGAVELLTFIITTWGVHAVELFERMAWNQHLNHQRPDAGGTPPYGLPARPAAPVRGGTVSLRDPSLLAQLGSPFDPFAHLADVKPPEDAAVAYNLPNLAVFLWRLKDYRLTFTKPHMRAVTQTIGAPHVVRVNVDPVPINTLSAPYVETVNTPAGRPVVIFNTHRLALSRRGRTDAEALNLAAIRPTISTSDQVPAPMPVARISDREIAAAYDASLASPTPQPLSTFTDASFTAPQEYVTVESYDETLIDPGSTLQLADVGLQLHLPETTFPAEAWPHTALPRTWTIRGENLCAWERGLRPPLASREIAIDPVRGRICVGAPDQIRADAIVSDLLVTFTYGAPGPVGAHPVSYPPLPKAFDQTQTPAVIFATATQRDSTKQLQAVLKKALQDARAIVAGGGAPPPAIVIEITDSGTHPLDVAALDAADINAELGASVLLHCPLIVRSADDQRPVIALARPLAFRPAKVTGADATEQDTLDTRMRALFVRLEGLYIARALNYAAAQPLISRAALNKLEILSCTLDPGGFRRYAGTRAPLLPAINLRVPYGFSSAGDEQAFRQTPEIIVQRSITGAIGADEGYRLCCEDAIVESMPVTAGGVTSSIAITSATSPATGYAGATALRNVTVLGRMRLFSVDGSGAIITGALEAFDQQSGCLKHSCVAADAAPGAIKNRLPPHLGCVSSDEARLVFTSEYFGDAGYCQLSLAADPRILGAGVEMDQMGAFNCLREAHKWANLRIRLREFAPVGSRPLLIAVT